MGPLKGPLCTLQYEGVCPPPLSYGPSPLPRVNILYIETKQLQHFGMYSTFFQIRQRLEYASSPPKNVEI